MSTWFKQRAEWLWAPAFYAVVVLLLYRIVWWGIDGEVRWFGWDCIEYYWPDMAYYAGAIRAGDLPLWNPYDRGGYPYYADMHVGFYYPVNWLFGAAGAIAGAVPGWVIQAKAILHIAMGGMAIHLFARTRGLRPVAAMVGGVAWMVSLPMIIHKASALEWPMVWTPVVWVAIEIAITRAREDSWWRGAAALGGAMWIAGASAPPQGFFFVLLPSLAYGGFRLSQRLLEVGRGGLRTEALAQAKTLAVAAAVVVGMLLILMGPAAETVSEGTRGQRSAAYPFHTALPVWETLRALITPAAGKVDVYPGVLALACALLGLLLNPRRDRWVPVFCAIGAAIFVTMTFGEESSILRFAVEHLPGFGLFREPNRYKCIAALLLAIGSAYGVESFLCALESSKRRALVAVAAVFGGLLLAVAIFQAVGFANMSKVAADYGTSYAVLGGGVAVVLATLFSPLGRRWIPFLLVVLVYVDGSSFGYEFANLATEKAVDDQEDRLYLDGLADVTTEWRVYDEFVMEQRAGSRLRIRNFRGYPSGAPFQDLRHNRLLTSHIVEHPELLEVFNVRYVLHGRHHRQGTRKNHLKVPPTRRAPTHFKKIDAKRYEARHPVPLIVWYGAATVVDGPEQAITALIPEEADGSRPRVVVERPDVPPAQVERVEALSRVSPAPTPVQGTLVSFEANRVEIAIDAPADGIVVLNEKLMPGWQVAIDGADADGFRGNYLSRAVTVASGQHTIVWSFRPPHYRLLASLFLAGLGFLLASLIVEIRSRGRARTG